MMYSMATNLYQAVRVERLGVVFFVIHRRKSGTDGTQYTDSVALFIIAKVPSVEEVAFSEDSSLSCTLGKSQFSEK